MLNSLPSVISAPPLAPLISEPRVLTELELRILTLAGSGLSNEEIAFDVSFSEGQIKNLFTDIFKALGVVNRVSAIVVALQRGIIGIDALHVPVRS